MPTTGKNLGFGSRAKRFGKVTLHPNLDPAGIYCKRPLACDPCRYHPQPLHKIFEVNRFRKVDKDPWQYKKELEEWAQNLGYRNEPVLETRKWFLSLGGPAWTEPKEVPKYEPACRNVGFGRTPRTKPTRNQYPGPGTYYKAVPYKVPYGPHSKRPTFHREEPCRFKDTSKKWNLPPNRYNIIDKESIEHKPKKIVSLRGPYDLFTGKRGATKPRCSAATWPIALKSTLDKYLKSHFGTMNKTNRSLPYRGRNALVDLSMCVRKPEEPGPAHQNIDKPKEFKENFHGFNSSYCRPPGYTRVIVWPAVGRYRVKKLTCGIPGRGHPHVFLSKVGRTIGAYLPEKLNTF